MKFNMSMSSEEYNNIIDFFAEKSSSTNILSVALSQYNDSIVATTTLDGGSDSNVNANVDVAVDNVNNDMAAIFFTNNFNATAETTNQSTVVVLKPPRISSDMPIWIIPCYSIIFFCAIVGNLLVISTLVQNRRMRTITNFFLLNLAISDMLLGVLCMPVTLVGTLLRHFIFGESLCKLIQFSQAASVAVSSWTLVAISCERYYAICHPLRSRTWQTINHAYKIIGFIWFGSIVCMTPIAIFSQLMPTSRQGLRKCREQWPDDSIGYERSYNIFLDLVLLVLPLMILCFAYILITRTLYIGMKNERAMIFGGSTCSGNGGSSNKMNTHVEAVATVTTTLTPSRRFNFNMSLRCRTRNRGGSGRSANGNIGIDTNSKYKHETEAFYQIQQQQQQKQQQTPKSQQQQQQQQRQFYDDISSQAACNNNKRKMLATSDGRRHLYCMRSTSVKSLHRTNNNNDSLNSSSMGMMGISPSMTVINVPQQQRFKLHQPRHHQQQQQQQQQYNLQHQLDDERHKSHSTPSLRLTEAALRRSNMTKNLESKRRVVKMLFVLVLEFFICWTPLYIINTVAMFIGPTLYEYIDYTTISFFHLLAYSSSCCNPITYCFMNAGFRRAFLDTFKGMQFNNVRFWRKRNKGDVNLSAAGNSITLANSGMTTATLLDSPRL